MTNIEVMTIYEKLSLIQNELKCPKNLYNSFGNYFYRNAETILDSVKPLCQKYRTTLLIQDEIERIENRYYVKAIVTLIDLDSSERIEVEAYARECEKKTGMDESQITGACSSYARKYALNGLFLIDDTKDADSNEQQNEVINKAKATPKQVEMLSNYYEGENLKKLLEHNKITKLEDMSKTKASELIKKIMERQNVNK